MSMQIPSYAPTPVLTLFRNVAEMQEQGSTQDNTWNLVKIANGVEVEDGDGSASGQNPLEKASAMISGAFLEQPSAENKEAERQSLIETWEKAIEISTAAAERTEDGASAAVFRDRATVLQNVVDSMTNGVLEKLFTGELRAPPNTSKAEGEAFAQMVADVSQKYGLDAPQAIQDRYREF